MLQRPDPLQQFASGYTLSKITAERTRERLESIVRRLHRMAGQLNTVGICISCRLGHSPVAVVSELAVIQTILLELPAEEQEALRLRAEEYARETLPFRGGRLHECQPACPFAVNGKCQIEDGRPFWCRLVDDEISDAKPKSLCVGHMIGLRQSGLDHQRVEVGLVIPALLDDPDWTERYLDGGRLFWEAAIVMPEQDPIIEHVKALEGSREPSGFGLDETVAANFQVEMIENGLENAIHILKGSSPLEQFLRIQVPWAYDSEDQITEWRERFVRTMREVVHMRFDLAEAFKAIKGRPTYALAYQGRDVKEILTEHGRTIIEPIIAQAFPELTAPIETPRKPGRLRVGYLSRSIYFSNGSLWSLGWLRNHGPEIESFVFATGDHEDDWNVQFRKAADHYYYLPSDIPNTARFIKSLDLDVMIFTDIGQLAMNYMYAGMRLARVQCTAWGFPVTSGLSTIDYYLSSELWETPASDSHYSEKLVRLPGTGLCYPRPIVKPIIRTREDYGLPKGLLVGVLQSAMKCIPKWDSLFAQVNEATGVRIAFVDAVHPAVTRKTQKRMARAGVQGLWLSRKTTDEFHEMLSLFDILIDAPAWSGGITTLESIARGKPVITLPTEYMRGRFSKAFLTQAGMTRLIANSPVEYVAMVGDQELHRSVMENADLDGPFDDVKAAHAVNEWLLGTLNRPPRPS